MTHVDMKTSYYYEPLSEKLTIAVYPY